MRVWLIAIVFGASACSAIIDSDKSKLGALPLACEPGQRAACPCRDGSMSTQLCNDLARYDPCSCGPSSTAGATAGSSGARAGVAGATGGRGGSGGRGRAPTGGR